MNFAFWRRDEADTVASYALFGKLRHRADFIRINASTNVACEYDQLLASAIDRLAKDPGWEGAYDATQHAFLSYRSKDRKNWLIGCQCPSRDIGGRRFPLVAGLIIGNASIGADVPLIPLTYEVFFSGLAECVQTSAENSVDALGCRGFLESFAQIINQIGTDFELGQALFDKHISNRKASDLQALLHSAYPHAALDQAMLNIAFYANFIRHFPSALTAQEIVLPIPSKTIDGAIFASLWLGLVSRLAGDVQRIAGFYFRDDFIVIAIDTFSANFSPLLPLTHSIKLRGVTLSTEHETWVSHPLYPEISYAINRLFSDPVASVRTLFHFTDQIGRRICQSP